MSKLHGQLHGLLRVVNKDMDTLNGSYQQKTQTKKQNTGLKKKNNPRGNVIESWRSEKNRQSIMTNLSIRKNDRLKLSKIIEIHH